MPLDPMMSNAILGTFQKMADEIKAKNLSGEHVDKMMQTLDRMKELANIHDDMNAFNGQVMQENLYGKFGDYYGKAMTAQSAATSGSSSGGGNGDPDYLKQNLDALRDVIKRIRAGKEEALKMDKEYDPKKAMQQQMDFVERNKGKYGLEKGIEMSGGIDALKQEAEKDIDKTISEKPNAYDNSVEIKTLINTEGVIKPIENLISLGEQPGMSYPKFLRLQIEKGLDKAMEGSTVTKDGYEFLLGTYKALPYAPQYIEKTEKKIKLIDDLGANSKFGIPNSDEISYGHRRIDHEYEPSIILWKNITDRWETMLWDLYDWSLSHVSIAPFIFPWSQAPDPPEAVRFTKNTRQGIFRQREKLFKKYYGMDFPDIIKHPTFIYQIKNDLIWESQELFEFLLEKVYPLIQPFQFLPQDLINEREAIYKEKREANPDLLKPALRMAANYDRVFGEGRYLSKFGALKPIDTKAKPWKWNV